MIIKTVLLCSLFVIQYFCAHSEGVWTINSCVARSNVAVVSIAIALLPYACKER